MLTVKLDERTRHGAWACTDEVVDFRLRWNRVHCCGWWQNDKAKLPGPPATTFSPRETVMAAPVNFSRWLCLTGVAFLVSVRKASLCAIHRTVGGQQLKRATMLIVHATRRPTQLARRSLQSSCNPTTATMETPCEMWTPLASLVHHSGR